MTIGKYPYDVGDSIFDRHYGIKDEPYDGKKMHVTDVVEFECDGSHDVLMKLLTTVGVDRADYVTYVNKLAVVVGHGTHWDSENNKTRNTFTCGYSYDDTMLGFCTFYVIKD